MAGLEEQGGWGVGTPFLTDELTNGLKCLIT